MPYQTILPADIARLSAFDTCTIANAIEVLNVRLRNEGFICGPVQCRFPSLPPMLGYAATARVRTGSPPMVHRCYYDRMDWWNYVASIPEPRVMVLEDVDPNPGLGAFVGAIHAAIGHALNCVGCVTNGAVRDLPTVEALGFHLFSALVSVSHSYAHIIEFGEPVEITGLKVHSGDLLNGDCHGVQTIPLSIASKLAGEAEKVRNWENELMKFCRSPQFSLNELSNRLERANMQRDLPWRDR